MKSPRPSGQTGEGLQGRGAEMRTASSDMIVASRESSAVWPNRMMRAPRSLAAFAISRCRARRAAAGRPFAGLTPRQTSV